MQSEKPDSGVAMNATGAFGKWEYELAYSKQAFREALDRRLP